MITLFAMLAVDAYALAICFMVCALIITNNPK